MQFTKILNHKNTIWYILLFSFFLRFILVLSVDPYGGDTIDGYDYHNHAGTLLNGGDYPSHGSLPFMRPPLYPFFLSVVYYFFPHDSYLTARLVNAVLDVLVCYFFYKLIQLIWINQPTAVLSSLIYAINPLFIFFCLRVRVEVLFSLLLVAGIYLLVKAYKRDFHDYLTIALSGIVFGLACLCRPNAVLIVGSVSFWFILVKWGQWRKILQLGIVFIFACGIVILPWTARNYVKYDEVILITDGGGFNFWISNSELKAEDLAAETHQEYLDADRELWRQTAEIEQKIAGKKMKEREQFYFNRGTDYIKNNFWSWLRLTGGKILEFWSPFARFDMQGWKAILTFPTGLLMLLGLFSFVWAGTKGNFDRGIWLLIAFLIFSSAISGIVAWATIRYRVPTVDGYLIPFFVNLVINKFSSSEEVSRV